MFPAALKRPIAKWYLTPGKGSDLFTQEDKEDTAFVRGVPGTCTNEILVDFFNAGPLVKSQYNKKLITNNKTCTVTVTVIFDLS